MGPLDIEEKEERDLSWSDIGKGIGTGLNVVGKVYEAGDRAAGLHEPMEAISDKLAEIPVIGGATSFAWDVVRPDFVDAASFSGGPVAGAGQYTASLPAGVARAVSKRSGSLKKLGNRFKGWMDDIFDKRMTREEFDLKMKNEYQIDSITESDTYLPNPGPDEILNIHSDNFGKNTLSPLGLRNWGAKKRLSGARLTTGVMRQDEKTFVEAGWNLLDQMNKRFGIPITRKTASFQIHHKGVVRQIAETLNGLTDEAAKIGGDIMSNRLGYKLGYSTQNTSILPTKFHQRVHDIINNNISLPWGDNIKGLEKKLNLPPNWQTTMTLQDRIDAGIFDEVVNAINESTQAIDTFWKGVSTRTNLGKLTKDEYINATLEVLEADKKLSKIPRTRNLSPEEGYNITQAVNELLEKANRIDLQSPVFAAIEEGMSKELIRILLKQNGEKALWEVIISGKSPATVYKAYGIKPSNKLIKAIQKDDNAYQHMLRSRNKSIPPADSAWDKGQD